MINGNEGLKPGMTKISKILLSPPGKWEVGSNLPDISPSSHERPKLPSGGMTYEHITRKGQLESFVVNLPPQIIGPGKKLLENALDEANPEDAEAALEEFYRLYELHQAQITGDGKIMFGSEEHDYCTITPKDIDIVPGNVPFFEQMDENGYSFEILLSRPISLDTDNNVLLRASVGIHIGSVVSFDRLMQPIRQHLESGTHSEEFIRSHVNCYMRLLLASDPMLEEFKTQELS